MPSAQQCFIAGVFFAVWLALGVALLFGAL